MRRPPRTHQHRAQAAVWLALLTCILYSAALATAGPAPSQPGAAQATVAPTLIVSNATPIACGQTINGSTVESASQSDSYNCIPWWSETGPERIYSLNLTRATDLDVLIYSPDADLDLFLLSGSSPSQCLAYGDNALSHRQAPAGQYYLVVDGFQGAAGSFQLNLWCPLAVTPTVTATPTAPPTATPALPPLKRYLPLLLRTGE